MSEGVTESLSSLHKLTKDWGSREAVTLYLDRCQVDTPDKIVRDVWTHILERRSRVSKVVDFGAGDGRFANAGSYREYVGYEIDSDRCKSALLPSGATLIPQCAFEESITDADVCIGNPPYVRNQDLPEGWRHKVASSLASRTGITLSGLANAWQYFFLLSLASTKADGLVAIVIPYEWVSRPSARALREYIKEHQWNVYVYRLRDNTFDRVLTTSSITIIDKRNPVGLWKFFEEAPNGECQALLSESGGKKGVIDYVRRSGIIKNEIYAKRGLSPGTQEVLTLTEGERVRSGLHIGSDVVPCVTSLRHLELSCTEINEEVFKEGFRLAGHKCWLIRTDRIPSIRLQKYLASVPREKYQTATCRDRDEWWKFIMPEQPALLAATGFIGTHPKIVVNTVKARAVGGVCGIYGDPKREWHAIVRDFRKLDLSKRLVPHSNGLKKLEINQFNALLRSLDERKPSSK